MLQAIDDKQDWHAQRTAATRPSALAAARHDGKKHLLLAASGSVAAIKLPEMARSLSRFASTLSVRVVLTSHARRFLAGQSREQPTVDALRGLPAVDAVYQDADEWAAPGWTRGAPILHVELRRWADLLVVAPLSANMLAKLAQGLCDDLLSCVVRAWDVGGAIDGRKKRIVVAPAMNTAMWRRGFCLSSPPPSPPPWIGMTGGGAWLTR